ncbi:signal peptide peptidase SppA [Chondromyces crocatus]|uniref:Protease IV n=1 Tax=Chondromyces crocatus TaxID=52 RepID=A0A0K1E925_CHOCO|nr:signal peptide peptidase SppA [Chondromyces crocatus]AKT37359.1 protease IV [Chondromyces crocatus]
MILSLLLNLLRLLLLPFNLLRWWRAAPQGGYVVLEIDRALVDLPPPKRAWSPLRLMRSSPPPLSVERVRELCQLMEKDARVSGLLLEIHAVHCGAAALASLRDVLRQLRAAGKDVVAYLPRGADNQALLLAASARMVILGPGTQVAALGYAAEGVYLRRALEQLGVEPEVIARGEYKSAGEMLVRDEMSDAQREQSGALLDARYSDLVSAIAEGRKVDRATAARWIDEGPHGAAQAVGLGIVDAVAYEDELERVLGAPPRVPAARYERARRALRFRPLLPRPVLGVIEVHGAIVHRAPLTEVASPVRPGLVPGVSIPLASEERLVASLRAARQNPRIRGVVLHIDSPGGSALASDRIHHEVTRLAEVKPVVAYMSNVAASGGYYIAAGAQVIVAQPQSVTGSIGVVSARIALGPLLARLGVSIDVMKRGARADMLTASRKLDDEERAVLAREMESIYQTFLEVVARGRRKTVAEIEPLAGGRVYSGVEAHARGLVDKLGGFDVALRALRDRIGPPAARLEPVIVRVSRYVPPPPQLPQVPTPVPAVLSALGLRGASELLSIASQSGGERALTWYPGEEH